ncbi:hypothetical protein [Shewanella sp. YIC-542]|uniref:hypothetical protein n=1 Tax=Shewanella mytili TaxID=3377111 RepID=UPI00398EB097
MSYFLYGYNGLGNIGDDLMYLSLINSLPNDALKFSNDKQYEMPGGIRCRGFNLLGRIIFSDVFMIIGGNVFSYERKKSYLKLLFFVVVFAVRKISGKKNEIDSVGLDLKEGKFWRAIVLVCLSFVNEISLRDKLSYRYSRRYLKLNKISLKFDRVFRESKFIKGLTCEALAGNMDNAHKFHCDIIWWVSAPAYKKSKRTELLPNDLSKYKSECKGKMVVFFCQGEEDMSRADLIIANLNLENFKVFNYNFDNLNESLLYMWNAKKVITERYHGAVLAEVFDTKWASVSFTEKLSRVKPDFNKVLL